MPVTKNNKHSDVKITSPQEKLGGHPTLESSQPTTSNTKKNQVNPLTYDLEIKMDDNTLQYCSQYLGNITKILSLRATQSNSITISSHTNTQTTQSTNSAISTSDHNNTEQNLMGISSNTNEGCCDCCILL